jgi:hypothetical protein
MAELCAAAVEGSREKFHGARPVLGVHGWQNAAAAAAALDQAWQHVAHLCMCNCVAVAVAP